LQSQTDYGLVLLPPRDCGSQYERDARTRPEKRFRIDGMGGVCRFSVKWREFALR